MPLLLTRNEMSSAGIVYAEKLGVSCGRRLDRMTRQFLSQIFSGNQDPPKK